MTVLPIQRFTKLIRLPTISNRYGDNRIRLQILILTIKPNPIIV